MMNKVKFAFSVCLGVAVLSSTNKSSLALKTNNSSSFAASDFRIAVMTEAEKVAINEKGLYRSCYAKILLNLVFIA
jgi:hypothetical protein